MGSFCTQKCATMGNYKRDSNPIEQPSRASPSKTPRLMISSPGPMTMMKYFSILYESYSYKFDTQALGLNHTIDGAWSVSTTESPLLPSILRLNWQVYKAHVIACPLPSISGTRLSSLSFSSSISDALSLFGGTRFRHFQRNRSTSTNLFPAQDGFRSLSSSTFNSTKFRRLDSISAPLST